MLVRAMWLILFWISLLGRADEVPFWKSKEKFYDRVKEGEILVSVKSVAAAHEGFKNTLYLTGGGHVAAPADFVFATATDFQRVARLSGYITKAEYFSAQHRLELHLSAYGYETRMDLSLKVDKDSSPKTISYHVIQGPLHGLRGAINIVKLSDKRTEVGMYGEYNYDQLSLPQFFVEFGLEVIFQKMAARLRRYVEDPEGL